MKDREKKVELEALLGSLPEERFALFVNLAKKITDFGSEARSRTNGKYLNVFNRFCSVAYLIFLVA